MLESCSFSSVSKAIWELSLCGFHLNSTFSCCSAFVRQGLFHFSNVFPKQIYFQIQADFGNGWGFFCGLVVLCLDVVYFKKKKKVLFLSSTSQRTSVTGSILISSVLAYC